MRRIAAVAALGLAVAVAACGGDDGSDPPNLSASPSGGIDIRGEITQYSPPQPGAAMGAADVRGEVESDTQYDRAVVRIKEDTVVQRKQGAEVVPATFADLAVGTRVEIKFTGVVAELSPVQATAGEITIIE
jgi:hypothetical protein